jgi:hypothetical protein
MKGEVDNYVEMLEPLGFEFEMLKFRNQYKPIDVGMPIIHQIEKTVQQWGRDVEQSGIGRELDVFNIDVLSVYESITYADTYYVIHCGIEWTEYNDFDPTGQDDRHYNQEEVLVMGVQEGDWYAEYPEAFSRRPPESFEEDKRVKKRVGDSRTGLIDI